MNQIKGILNIPLLPLRSEPSERAEMVSQLLFGECFSVIKSEKDWSFLCNDTDGYAGWASTKMLTFLPEHTFELLKALEVNILSLPCTQFKTTGTSQQWYLPAGSRLYSNKPDGNRFVVFNPTQSFFIEFTDSSSIIFNREVTDSDAIIKTAMQFLNAPYLWGGKSVFGIDCSGFIQLVASIHGVQLPRDAKDQCQLGQSISYAEIRPGDVAFFKNDAGKIVHVGLLLSSGQILHASGCVRMDRLTVEGIFHSESNLQTHVLHEVKRIFNT